MDRFVQAIRRIDQANSADPNVERHEGRDWPAELLYSERMTRWLDRLCPEASEALRLAARAQHIRRWEIPRSSYPPGLEGYRAWRTRLYEFHADCAGQILREVGYEPATIDRVRSLLRKQRLKSDPECQTLEDVICLVFLESEFSAFAARHEPDKVVAILRRTWLKMSAMGREHAMRLNLGTRERELIGRALSKE